jgi:3'-phosphoadenosine 5'-phosphosulfate sulfotransferase (PAPS reductase)/FAD synthetase
LEIWELKQKQSLSLDQKIILSKQRIREWIDKWDYEVYVSFSGGKDSTVLAHLVKQVYPNIRLVFVDTGMEYPEIRNFCKKQENMTILRPKMNFKSVIEKYGYPIISKRTSRYIRDLRLPIERNTLTQNLRRTGYNSKGVYCPNQKLSNKWKFLVDAPFKISEQCCDVMKKEPFKRFEKETGLKPFTGEMAEDNDFRRKEYIKTGCNAFDTKNPKSRPLGFWVEQDILEYIETYNIPYCNIYGDIMIKDCKYITTGERRTGCVFCMFGIHLEKEDNRFKRLSKTHPALWNYCMNTLKMKEVLDYLKIEGC